MFVIACFFLFFVRSFGLFCSWLVPLPQYSSLKFPSFYATQCDERIEIEEETRAEVEEEEEEGEEEEEEEVDNSPFRLPPVPKAQPQAKVGGTELIKYRMLGRHIESSVHRVVRQMIGWIKKWEKAILRYKKGN